MCRWLGTVANTSFANDSCTEPFANDSCTEPYPTEPS